MREVALDKMGHTMINLAQNVCELSCREAPVETNRRDHFTFEAESAHFAIEHAV